MNDVKDSLRLNLTKLLPTWDIPDSAVLSKTKEENKSDFENWYLFPLTEISVNNSTEDIAAFVTARYRTVLTAAYQANISVATVIRGEKGKITISLGFFSEKKSSEDCQRALPLAVSFRTAISVKKQPPNHHGFAN